MLHTAPRVRQANMGERTRTLSCLLCILLLGCFPVQGRSVHCQKLHFRKGTFKKKIHWNKCTLFISSSTPSHSTISMNYEKLHWKWENVGKHVNRIFEGKICERPKFTFPFSNMTEIFLSVIQSLVSCFQALIWKGDPRNIFFGQSSFALLAQQGEQTNK